MRWPRRPGTPASWNRRAVRRAVAVSLGTFFLGYLVTALTMIVGGHRPDVVTVPDVRKLPLARARRVLERAELSLVVGDSLPNAQVARGAVVAQSPLPGQEVGPDSRIRVILSRGRDRRVVPRVAAYAPGQAERILAASGFRVVTQAIPDLRAKGRVIGTVPAAGATAEVPGVIRLLVSAGPPIVAVPSVVGLPDASARIALQGTGLHVGRVEPLFRPDVAPGTVLGQSPAAGDSIEAGSRVTLQIATGEPPQTEVPQDSAPSEQAAEPGSGVRIP